MDKASVALADSHEENLKDKRVAECREKIFYKVYYMGEDK